jgi:predicted phosphodiesterase
MSNHVGVLFIGDPHLASRAPGFRKDDYPRTILAKLQFAISYARENGLLPVLLGDLFDFPRDNANWLLVALHDLLERDTLAIYGNHDCKENTPGDNDTISVLRAAGTLKFLSAESPWSGTINGCTVVVGGTCWGQSLPESFDCSAYKNAKPCYVLWATHHDLRFPGYEENGRSNCSEVPGIDLVVNGHIHRDLGKVVAGRTTWINPGILTRIARSDASRAHVPGMLRVNVSPAGVAYERVTVPHEPFDSVFHPEVQSISQETEQSGFIMGLAKLLAVRTASGAGLRSFLDDNLGTFEPAVAAEINRLAEEVLSNGK